MSKRIRILNCWVDAIQREEARDRVLQALTSGNRLYTVLSSNPEKNYSLPKNAVLHRNFYTTDILLPDGIGMVFAAKVLHGLKIRRIPGSEFFYDICEIAEKIHSGIFVYGGKENVNAKCCENIKKRFPMINIAGRSSGYIHDSEMTGLLDKINKSLAKILFIGLGSPKQEKWIFQYREELKHLRIVQGVGGTLDTIAGTVKRAPQFWCRHNLEWMYRLISNPRRIKRQIMLPVFAMQVIGEKLKRRIQ